MRAQRRRRRPQPMNTGSTITSRDSQEVRHIATPRARRAPGGRDGRTTRPARQRAAPATSRSTATNKPVDGASITANLPQRRCRTTRGTGPAPAPISVVSRITDQAGFIPWPRSCAAAGTGWRAWFPTPASARSRRARGSPSRPTDSGSCTSPNRRALVGQAITQAGWRSLRRQQLVVDAVDAQRALLHHLFLLVHFARAVGAGPGAVLAADALVVVDQHDAVLGALVGLAPVGHTGTQGGSSQCRQDFGKCTVSVCGKFADFEGLHAVEEGAARVLAVRDSGRSAGPPRRRCSIPCSSSTQAWQPTQTFRSITKRVASGAPLRSGGASNCGR